MYSEQVLRHFAEPRFTGELPDANARVTVENPVCGDVLELTAQVSGGVIHEIRFRAKGCVPLVAAASMFVEWAQRRQAIEVAALDSSQLRALTGEMPQASSHVLDVIISATKKLLPSSAIRIVESTNNL